MELNVPGTFSWGKDLSSTTGKNGLAPEPILMWRQRQTVVSRTNQPTASDSAIQTHSTEWLWSAAFSLDGGNIQNATTWKLRKWEQNISTVLREMDCRQADKQKWLVRCIQNMLMTFPVTGITHECTCASHCCNNLFDLLHLSCLLPLVVPTRPLCLPHALMQSNDLIFVGWKCKRCGNPPKPIKTVQWEYFAVAKCVRKDWYVQQWSNNASQTCKTASPRVNPINATFKMEMVGSLLGSPAVMIDAFSVNGHEALPVPCASLCI